MAVDWQSGNTNTFHANPIHRRNIMQWTTPAYTDLRFGFEITMYIANR
ncbi:coenzyme PQQ synthesis protein [Pandoraea thiooxydans]|nr:coenzyme PQQ synthesis protein [Pandoraea thiooxydans]